ncbi:MAG: hypothetical protein P8I03_09755 [Thalassotalea sp.]|nr:hypothetical protein [Thalassotalea sp.]
MFNQKRYIVWNPWKVAVHDGSADTYEELLETEKQQDCSWSSEVYTSNIEGVIQAIQNETDVDMKYQYCPLTFTQKYRVFKYSVSVFIKKIRMQLKAI